MLLAELLSVHSDAAAAGSPLSSWISLLSAVCLPLCCSVSLSVSRYHRDVSLLP